MFNEFRIRNIVFIVLSFLIITVNSHAETLFQPESFDSYTSDNKAAKVGDILTVLIIESAEATSSSSSSNNKSAGISAGINFPNTNKQGILNFGQDFSGGGQVEQEGQLLARLTVSVVKVLPNGYILVRGNQEVTVNAETQLIDVEGKVRVRDISSNNTILSTRISDAKISYNGKGLIQDRQSPGLLSQLLTAIGFLL